MHSNHKYKFKIGTTWKSKSHKVLLGVRKTQETIINGTKYKYTKRVLNAYHGCTCIHGSRTICADSHAICALRKMRMIVNGEKLEFENLSERKWGRVMDINHFKTYLKDLDSLQLKAYVYLFLNKKEVPPLNS